MSKTCSKGWTARCACAKGKRCKCACGGENHGEAHKRQIEIELDDKAGRRRSATQCRGRSLGSKPNAVIPGEASPSCTSGGRVPSSDVEDRLETNPRRSLHGQLRQSLVQISRAARLQTNRVADRCNRKGRGTPIAHLAPEKTPQQVSQLAAVSGRKNKVNGCAAMQTKPGRVGPNYARPEIERGQL